MPWEVMKWPAWLRATAAIGSAVVLLTLASCSGGRQSAGAAPESCYVTWSGNTGQRLKLTGPGARAACRATHEKQPASTDAYYDSEFTGFGAGDPPRCYYDRGQVEGKLYFYPHISRDVTNIVCDQFMTAK